MCLRPDLDSKQFVEIEKKLTILFREMNEEQYRPYFVETLKIIESLVVKKNQITPTCSYGLKNLLQVYKDTEGILKRSRSLVVFTAYGQEFLRMNPSFY